MNNLQCLFIARKINGNFLKVFLLDNLKPKDGLQKIISALISTHAQDQINWSYILEVTWSALVSLYKPLYLKSNQ